MPRPFKWGFYDEEGRDCTTCKEYKKYSFYHKHSGCPNGYNTVCKECRKGSSRSSYQQLSTQRLLFDRAKSRANVYNIPFNIEVSDIVIPEYCPVLNLKLKSGSFDTAPSLDKIIPEIGYVKGNIQVISNKANRMKSDASVEELKLFAKWVCECL